MSYGVAEITGQALELSVLSEIGYGTPLRSLGPKSSLLFVVVLFSC